MAERGRVEHLQPEGLHHNPAYSQVITVTGSTRTVYVGGQNAVDASGAIVGRGDLAAQTEQIMRNIQVALAAAGADLADVVKLGLLIVGDEPLGPGFAAFQRAWGARGAPPVITMARVAGLANPDFLAEIDAVAVVPVDPAA